ncbi:MAG: DUF1684 domain-containing protein [Wenzhouxiangella sp.]|nr:MAG: DUF1684 domain-containing protein [Wenzhouxiangella sp.]
MTRSISSRCRPDLILVRTTSSAWRISMVVPRKSRVMLLVLLGSLLPALAVHADDGEAAALEWREQRLERLTAPFGWLSLVALEFLGDGTWAVGSANDKPVRLPSGPEHWGDVVVEGPRAWFEPEPGAEVLIEDAPVPSRRELVVGGEEPATRVHAGTGWFEIARRGDRLVLRARDSEAVTRREFLGLDYFEFDPDWRIDARWEPHPEGSTIPIADVLGELRDQANPGRAVFEFGGRTYSLEALAADDELFFIFADRTSGRSTYGLGRFLYSDLPEEGRVELDFNRAYNPPCAFNAYTTCPLPPPENRLDVQVEAGELRYRGSGGVRAEDLSG